MTGLPRMVLSGITRGAGVRVDTDPACRRLKPTSTIMLSLRDARDSRQSTWDVSPGPTGHRYEESRRQSAVRTWRRCCTASGICGSRATRTRIPTALALVASGQIDARPLVTHRFPLEEVAQAFATVQDVQSGAVKVIVDVGGRG